MRNHPVFCQHFISDRLDLAALVSPDSPCTVGFPSKPSMGRRTLPQSHPPPSHRRRVLPVSHLGPSKGMFLGWRKGTPHLGATVPAFFQFNWGASASSTQLFVPQQRLMVHLDGIETVEVCWGSMHEVQVVCFQRNHWLKRGIVEDVDFQAPQCTADLGS